MMDIETLGIVPGSVIIQIGAVDFDIDNIGEGFKINITRSSCEQYNMKTDPSTVRWWKKQSPAAIASVSAEPRVHISDALEQFNEWFRSVGGQNVWGNGATFDNVLMDIAYRVTRVERPWHFTGDRDLRTLVAVAGMMGIEEPRVNQGVAHDGLDDAISQALWAQNILRRMTAF